MTASDPRPTPVLVTASQRPTDGQMPSPRTDGQSGAPRAVIVFDDPLASLLAVTLRHGRYETRVTTDRAEALLLLRDWQPQLACIDIDRYEQFIDLLGGGMEHGHMPLLAFTRRRSAAVKLHAFERGVDDIVEVPFTIDELVIRPFVLMRRAHGIFVPLIPTVRIGRLEVDLIEQRARIEGTELKLTPIQQTLLYLLAANTGRVLTREQIMGSIWGGDFEIESNVVDRHIRELRVRLGDDWRAPKFIETVPGAGYRFTTTASTVTA
jgi:DNA-binding response OmpR family regulator